MVDLIDQQREAYGVEPICALWPIAPSTYYRCKQLARYPQQRRACAQRDAALRPEIVRVYEDNHGVYGARKIWKQLNREGIEVACCTVEHLMKALGLVGIRRGRCCVITVADDLAEKPQD